jgi:DNA-directed RNA polymerase
VTTHEIKLNYQDKTFKTYYNVHTNKPDTNSLKNALFVNIIHSLDALHIQIVINSLRTNIQTNQLLTIHDAYLIRANYPKQELLNSIHNNFKLIHSDKTLIRNMVNRLAKRLGKHHTFNEAIRKVGIKLVQIKQLKLTRSR